MPLTVLRAFERDAIAKAFTLFDQDGLFEIWSTPDLLIRFRSAQLGQSVILVPDRVSPSIVRRCFPHTNTRAIHEREIAWTEITPASRYLEALSRANVLVLEHAVRNHRPVLNDFLSDVSLKGRP